MRNKFLILCLTLLTAPQAMADGGDGFGSVFNMFFGTEQARAKNATCDAGSGDNGGLMGVVNSFFCHMEKDMGITGVTTGVTKQFTDSNGTMSVHAEVAQGTYSVDGVSYDYNAKVWVCSAADCSAASSFSRAINIYFSYASDKTINKGHLLMNPGAFEGTTAAINFKYDVGSSTSSKSLLAKVLNVEGADTFRMRMEGTKSSAGVLSITGLMSVSGSQSVSMRLASQLDTVANSGAVYFEFSGATGAGVGTYSGTAVSDDKSASSMAFTRTASATDWTYTGTGAAGTVPAFPAVSGNTVGAYSASSILTISSEWEGMAANPSSI